MKPLFVVALFCVAAMAQDQPKNKTNEMPKSLASLQQVQKDYSSCLTNFQQSAKGKSFVQVDWDQERTCDRSYRMNLKNWADNNPEAAAAMALQQANRGYAVEALASESGK